MKAFVLVKVAKLLGCTSWLGGGPGLMDAGTRDALEAGKPVGGFNIAQEAGEWKTAIFHPYLLSHAYLTCRFFSARKHGLMDADVRSSKGDKTGVIVLPVSLPFLWTYDPIEAKGLIPDLPRLPFEVKFDLKDQEVIEHLKAKVGCDTNELHPLLTNSFK
ncbi:unnamed protein product [Lactuca saligna]|uniref:Uncharacterized protein n=1 Tax=Lactuca saligna TaxID=75948 RepID=A0AA36E4B9_LACSI|nr:unnamed protein product [Lactuca saligna]